MLQVASTGFHVCYCYLNNVLLSTNFCYIFRPPSIWNEVDDVATDVSVVGCVPLWVWFTAGPSGGKNDTARHFEIYGQW